MPVRSEQSTVSIVSLVWAPQDLFFTAAPGFPPGLGPGSAGEPVTSKLSPLSALSPLAWRCAGVSLQSREHPVVRAGLLCQSAAQLC